MKNLIKTAGYKKIVATSLFALTNVAVFANTGSDNSSSSGAAVIGFFAVMVGALLLPAIGHKAHH
jgi:hypothetical protein